MFKGEKGITLVALVVTIVVLLILAGVSISLVIGQNGMITKAKEAQISQDKAYAEDTVSTALKAVQIEDLSNTVPTADASKSIVQRAVDKITDNKFTVSGSNINYEAKDGTNYLVTIDAANSTSTYSVTSVAPVK